MTRTRAQIPANLDRWIKCKESPEPLKKLLFKKYLRTLNGRTWIYVRPGVLTLPDQHLFTTSIESSLQAKAKVGVIIHSPVSFETELLFPKKTVVVNLAADSHGLLSPAEQLELIKRTLKSFAKAKVSFFGNTKEMKLPQSMTYFGDGSKVSVRIQPSSAEQCQSLRSLCWLFPELLFSIDCTFELNAKNVLELLKLKNVIYDGDSLYSKRSRSGYLCCIDLTGKQSLKSVLQFIEKSLFSVRKKEPLVNV